MKNVQTIYGNGNTASTSVNIYLDSTKGKGITIQELMMFLKGIQQVNMTIIVQSADKINNSLGDK